MMSNPTLECPECGQINNMHRKTCFKCDARLKGVPLKDPVKGKGGNLAVVLSLPLAAVAGIYTYFYTFKLLVPPGTPTDYGMGAIYIGGAVFGLVFLPSYFLLRKLLPKKE